MNDEFSDAVRVTKNYYDSDDAHNFYYTICGGEDLHLGIYESEKDSIFEASRRTIRQMAEKSAFVGKNARVIDLGGGFSGSALRHNFCGGRPEDGAAGDGYNRVHGGVHKRDRTPRGAGRC